jgi:hypothetical protein
VRARIFDRVVVPRRIGHEHVEGGMRDPKERADRDVGLGDARHLTPSFGWWVTTLSASIVVHVAPS